MRKNKTPDPDEEVKYEAVRERDQFTVVLERMESKLDQIIEGQQMWDEKFDRLEADTQSNFTMLADHLVQIHTEAGKMHHDPKKKDQRLDTIQRKSKTLRRMIEAEA